MKINELAAYLSKREGKKSQVKIGDMREIVGILCDIFWKELSPNPGKGSNTFRNMISNGRRRATRK